MLAFLPAEKTYGKRTQEVTETEVSSGRGIKLWNHAGRDLIFGPFNEPYRCVNGYPFSSYGSRIVSPADLRLFSIHKLLFLVIF